jgi:hypothetical protein
MTDRSWLNGNPHTSAGPSCNPRLAIVGFVLGIAAWWLSGILAFPSRCGPDAGELAMDLARRYADEPSPNGYRSRIGRKRLPRAADKMEQPSCGTDWPGNSSDVGVPVGAGLDRPRLSWPYKSRSSPPRRSPQNAWCGCQPYQRQPQDLSGCWRRIYCRHYHFG